MSRIPVILRLALFYLPPAGLIAYFSTYPWWATAAVGLFAFIISCALWLVLPVEPAGQAVSAGDESSLFIAVRKLTGSAGKIKLSLEELSRALKCLAEGNAGMTGFAEELKVQIEAIEGQITALAEAGTELGRQADESINAAEKGRPALEKAEKLIAENKTATLTAGQKAEQLAASFQDIVEVAGTIKSFANQTGTLALNAENEAAQAGEAGRGFAVAAELMGRLAVNSAQAAEDINRLVSEADPLIGAFKEKADESRESLNRQDLVFEELRLCFEEFATAAGISAAQAAAFNGTNKNLYEVMLEVRKGADNLFDLVQLAAASSEEISASTAEQQPLLSSMNDASLGLTGQIESFKKQAGRHTVPRLAYMKQPEEIAAAYLFKHWYKRDCDQNVALIELEEEDLDLLYTAMSIGELDATLSCRTPHLHEPYVDGHNGKLDYLCTNLAGVRAGLLVPDYVTADSIEELKEWGDKFGRAIYVPKESEALSKQAADALKTYNLDYSLDYPANGDACATLNKALDNEQWIVLAGRMPDPLLARNNFKFLDDPAASFGEEQFMKTVTRMGLGKAEPCFYRALQKFRWGVADAAYCISLMNRGLSPDTAAKKVLAEIDALLS